MRPEEGTYLAHRQGATLADGSTALGSRRRNGCFGTKWSAASSRLRGGTTQPSRRLEIASVDWGEADSNAAAR
jgi:hypothetical protein